MIKSERWILKFYYVTQMKRFLYLVMYKMTIITLKTNCVIIVYDFEEFFLLRLSPYLLGFLHDIVSHCITLYYFI